jgi:hypothetical protein
MKVDIELLRADVLDELSKIGLLEREFRSLEDWLSRSDEQVGFIEKSALGYLLHNFYNGCEAIFLSIAGFFENDLDTGTWHKDLLKRMKLDIPGFRPPVIEEELYRTLDDFRGFRHKFRHSYSFDLDWERERAIARKFLETSSELRSQVSRFLDTLAAEDEDD